ncbi:hypothetical protein HHK36_026545 [Tetracentron sinense]|uniref:FLZ-type domain-containing protein n=1 Tax=Tetracentron sinense TaxID=13715 RepID=A0A835D2A1_TETSI|nr:hypothetical protein HHK36_026545 [Tetracentron sinense]
MVGLSILLEAQKNHNRSPKVINKINIFKPSPTPPPPPAPSSSLSLPAITFLEECFLCKQTLLPGKDIYMYNLICVMFYTVITYRGDRAFCSVECRCRQISMDEESVMRENCSLAAMKPATSSSSPASRHRRGTRNRAGGFAY